jgi:hypothetical protein
MKVNSQVRILSGHTFSGCYGVVAEVNPISSGSVVGDYAVRLTASDDPQHIPYMGMAFIVKSDQIAPISEDEYVRGIEITNASLVVNA